MENEVKNSAFWRIIAVKTDENKAWWESAQRIFADNPDAVPEVLHPLIDPTWNETEAMATRNEVKYAQAWLIGVPGWNDLHSPLLFKK